MGTNTLSFKPRKLVSHPIFNALWFNIFWFIAVIGRNELALVLLALLAWHLIYADSKYNESIQCVSVAIIGICLDATLSFAGIFRFEGDVYIPLWLCLLWFAFATTLSRCFRFLQSRLLIAACLGGVGGASSYFAGYQLGAVDLPLGVFYSCSLLALIWFFLFPLLLTIARLLTEMLRGHTNC